MLLNRRIALSPKHLVDHYGKIDPKDMEWPSFGWAKVQEDCRVCEEETRCFTIDSFELHLCADHIKAHTDILDHRMFRLARYKCVKKYALELCSSFSTTWLMCSSCRCVQLHYQYDIAPDNLCYDCRALGNADKHSLVLFALKSRLSKLSVLDPLTQILSIYIDLLFSQVKVNCGIRLRT